MDDFFLRAIFAGVGVALAAGPLGCFIVWRRMAYFGAALSHSALLGVAIGVVLGVNLTLAVLLFCLLLAVLLMFLERRELLASDTLLGILAHGALAVGLVVVSLVEAVRVDLMSYLFGDVLAVTKVDVLAIFGLTSAILVGLKFIWRPLLSLTVSRDLAAVEGVAVTKVRLSFVLMVACVIAVGMKVVGILLIISLLIIPAASARRLSSTPEQMALLAAVFGVAAVIIGLFASLQWDIPSGPAIVVVATAVFCLIFLWPWRVGVG